MKTSILILVAALLLIVSNGYAEKYNPRPLDACPGNESAFGLKHSTKHYSAQHFKSEKTAQGIRKKNKGFETPKNKISKSRKNPNHTKSEFRDGGFYSFRRQNYSAHIFHNHP